MHATPQPSPSKFLKTFSWVLEVVQASKAKKVSFSVMLCYVFISELTIPIAHRGGSGVKNNKKISEINSKNTGATIMSS